MRPLLGFTKESSALPHVVWAEESKTGLRFETRASYDVVPTRFQLVTHRQSSCTCVWEFAETYQSGLFRPADLLSQVSITYIGSNKKGTIFEIKFHV